MKRIGMIMLPLMLLLICLTAGCSPQGRDRDAGNGQSLISRIGSALAGRIGGSQTDGAGGMQTNGDNGSGRRGSNAVTAQGQLGDNVEWMLYDDGCLTVFGSGAMWDYTYDTDSPVAQYHDQIRTVEIVPGVETIGDYVFAGMDHLTDIRIPDTVIRIGDGCLRNCTCLETVVLPDSVTEIGGGAFLFSTALRTVRMPAYVTLMGTGVFHNCSALTEITIPDGVDALTKDLFYGCSALRVIRIPLSVIRIEDDAFTSGWIPCTMYYAGSTADWDMIDTNYGYSCSGGKYFLVKKGYFQVYESQQEIVFGSAGGSGSADVTFPGTEYGDPSTPEIPSDLPRDQYGSGSDVNDRDRGSMTSYDDIIDFMNPTTEFYDMFVLDEYVSDYGKSLPFAVYGNTGAIDTDGMYEVTSYSEEADDYLFGKSAVMLYCRYLTDNADEDLLIEDISSILYAKDKNEKTMVVLNDGTQFYLVYNAERDFACLTVYDYLGHPDYIAFMDL
ncbi:MAG: leucine-rich repeat domain-containing protein [Clostridia bacterium]|nr:leucine-rich repeat domain-containing protein [Clostridia bacterium]